MYVDLNLRAELGIPWHAFLRRARSRLLNVNLASRWMYQTFKMLCHQLNTLNTGCQFDVSHISYQEFPTFLCLRLEHPKHIHQSLVLW